MRIRLPAWLTRRRFGLDEREFQDELRAHLAIAEREKIAGGLDARSARYAALREFGNVTQTTEAARRVWTPRWMEAARELLRDVRHAVRSLSRQRGFALTVIGVLTLGIGLNAAIFSMIKSMALAPVAGVSGSAQLQVVFRQSPAGRALKLSYPDYRHLRDHNGSFSDLFGTTFSSVGFTKDGHARPVWVEMVTGNYFRALGVSAQAGRTLLPSDEVAAGAHPVAVISDGFWRREFGADPAVLGQTLQINGVELTIVGVADAAFHGSVVSYDVEVFVPIMMGPSLGYLFATSQTTAAGAMSDRGGLVFMPMSFLRPGVTAGQAQRELDAIWTGLAPDRSQADAADTLRAVPFMAAPGTGPTYLLPTLLGLAAMGVLVLLIACANIAGLVLVRGVSRRGELAMRLALGASRARIVRLLVIENVVLALPGALLGVIVAASVLPVLVRFGESMAAPQRVFLNVGIDWLVIGYAVAIGCGSALVFGFMPALRSSRVNLRAVTAELSPRGPARGRFRAGLVVAQVAVSFLLLVGSALLARSLDAARAVHPGFDSAGVAALDLDVKQAGRGEASGRQFYRDLLERMRAAPGIQSATLAAYSPLNFTETRTVPVTVEGHAPGPRDDPAMLANHVAPGYFETLSVPMLAGRTFADSDDASAAPVVIVNRTFAERFWGSPAQAIGRRLTVAGSPARTVVGVAQDLKYLRVDEPPRPYVYVPVLQAYRSTLTLYVKGGDDVGALTARARDVIRATDAGMPILSDRPLTARIANSFFLFALSAMVLLVLGVAGLLLAALGTYGLVSYSVKQAAHEIGIRMALGASSRSVIGLFLGRGLRLGFAGAAAGLLGALLIAPIAGGMIFGVGGADVVSLAQSLGVVLGGVLLATFIPARRAARTNPLRALRHP